MGTQLGLFNKCLIDLIPIQPPEDSEEESEIVYLKPLPRKPPVKKKSTNQLRNRIKMALMRNQFLKSMKTQTFVDKFELERRRFQKKKFDNLKDYLMTLSRNQKNIKLEK